MVFDPTPDQISRLVRQTLNYLSLREHSVKEVTVFVSKKSSGNQLLVDAVMEKITKFNLLNDSSFAQNWLQFRISHHKGPLLISAELKQKGIKPDLINQIITGVTSETWIESAFSLLDRKRLLTPTHLTQADKARIYRLLASRGFTSQTIYSVIDAVGAK
jgi:regulatory protein